MHKASARFRKNGFTILELLIAATVFLIIASTAFSLFNQHLILATRQENLSGVNIGIRNAMAQLEMDLAAGGQNLLGTVQVGAPVFGIGVNIQNNVPSGPNAAPTCQMNSNWSYPVPSACYDGLTIYTLKPCTTANGSTAPVLVISDPGNSQESLSSSSIIWGTDNNTGANLSNDASCFQNGDEILVVQFPNSGQTMQCDSNQANYCMAVVTLTKDAQVSGGKVQLQHNPTGAGSDPLGVIFGGNAINNFSQSNGLGIGYSNGAYIIDLGTSANTVTYSVQTNPSNSADPQLVRCTGGSCTAVADQIIGFKVGAALWDNHLTNGTDIANYFYNAANYCNGANTDCSISPPAVYDPYDFSLVRAVRISLIARTTPASDQSFYRFQNGFDQGPYLVQQSAVVVDLRNMSNNEFDN